MKSEELYVYGRSFSVTFLPWSAYYILLSRDDVCV